MVFEHKIQAGKKIDTLVHQALGKADRLEVIPMHEPNYMHDFDLLGVLPEGEL